MSPTGMKCARCGKADDVIDLEGDLVNNMAGDWFVILQCKRCLRKPVTKKMIELKYNYRVPIFIPKDKEMLITVKQKTGEKERHS